MNEKKYSYSSANTIPMKIVCSRDIMDHMFSGLVPSSHVQLNPTNKCNFLCDFCSCSERDKQLELSYDDIIKLFNIGKHIGFDAVTITGGGEPTLHPRFDDIVNMIVDEYDCDVGLVTNGTRLHLLESLDNLMWCRISASDYLEENLNRIGIELNNFLVSLYRVVNKHPKVDWAFSYVLGDKPNISLIKELINFANHNKFTHVRIVNDIFIADELTEQMNYVKEHMKKLGVNDDIVNYQDRSKWSKGMSPCYISLLKPVIGADGGIYPCCGTQYALNDPSRDYEKLMKMGDISDLLELSIKQEFFDGSMCSKCYYNQYNELIYTLLNGLKHKRFV